MGDLEKLKSNLLKEAGALPKADAIAKGICIRCRETALPKCYSSAGRQEYFISGLCEPCFDVITKGPEEPEC